MTKTSFLSATFSACWVALWTLLAPLTGWAEHWISISSFNDRDLAETALAQAQRRTDQKVVVMAADTEAGFFFRVAAGPYADFDAASGSLSVLQRAGYSDAWIWRQPSAPGETSQTAVEYGDAWSGRSDNMASGFAPLGSDTSINFTRERLDEFPATRQPSATNSEPPVEDGTQLVPELLDTAPEGYKLHKLDGDAQARPPPTTDNPEVSSSTFAATSPLLPTTAITKILAIENKITIDGALTESVWQQALTFSDFLVVDPESLRAPLYTTKVRFLYSDEGLYAGFDMQQPIDTLLQRYSGRDKRRIRRDVVGLTLDTSGQGRYGYWFNVALGDNQGDGTLLPERQFSSDWDGAWYAKTQKTASGWAAEMFIPWSQMALPAAQDQRQIGMYVSRNVGFLDERWGYPALTRSDPRFISALHPLSLDKVDPPQQWSAFPYVSIAADQVADEIEYDVGADLFWRPSSNFQATAAILPDFGGVESDDVILNLSAFETFFPEKRLFFQEGIEVFTATPRADGDSPVTLLNTRRIGGESLPPKVPDGVEVSDRELAKPTSLLGAMKVVGSIGAMRYGLLGAVEDDMEFLADDGARYYQDGSDYAAARVLIEGKSGKGAYRSVGLLSTITEHSEADSQAHAVDYHFLSKEGEWKIDGQLLYSSTHEDSDGFGGFVDVSKNLRYGSQIDLGIAHYDDRLDINDLGYLRRNDVSEVAATWRVRKTDSERYRKYFGHYSLDYRRNGDGAVLMRRIAGRLGWDLNNRDQVRMDVSYQGSSDDDRSSRNNGVFTLDDRHEFGIEYSTDDAKPMSISVAYENIAEDIGGLLHNFEVQANWQPKDNIRLRLKAVRSVGDSWLLWQQEDRFQTFSTHSWEPELSFAYFISAKQQIQLSSQWVGIRAKHLEDLQLVETGAPLALVSDTADETQDFTISNLSLQLRYRWEIAPLSELFVVYTRNGDDAAALEDPQDNAFDALLSNAFNNPVDEQLVIKLRYRLGT